MPAIHAIDLAARRSRTALWAALTLTAAVLLLASTAAVARSGPTVIHVDASASGVNDGSSWSDAYTALQDAFDEVNASPGTD
ncbi:hypothetical protein [Arhodomonas sp. AD133]|uniref:hypothetical protein n=1 Tax=Arhodomonas sp. AD133 TaxID=3415009 RepID=UPI003EBEF225